MFQDRTKKLFADTFAEMMRTMKIEDIRVRDLCLRCGTSRRTFYYHFSDKYELMAWIIDRAFNPAVEGKTALFDVPTRVKVLESVRLDGSFYRNIYIDANISDMLSYLVEYDVGHYEDTAKEILEVDKLDAYQLFSIRMFVYGGIYMTREWILDGFRTEPSLLAELMQASMPPWLSELASREDAST